MYRVKVTSTENGLSDTHSQVTAMAALVVIQLLSGCVISLSMDSFESLEYIPITSLQ